MLDFLRHASTPPSDLLGIIRYVRARWRARLAVKGAVRAFVMNVAVFFALAYLMEWSRFTPASILFARLVLAASIVGSLYFFLVKPLRRRGTDDQVALYLEEKEPSLQTMLVSAVESSREGRHWESSALVEKRVAQGIEKCWKADAPRRAELGPLRTNGAVFVGVVTAAILAVLLGPAFFRDALSAVLILSQSIEAAAPYKIAVTPGDIAVIRGTEVKVIITPTMKTNGGRIALAKQAVPLTVEADGTLTASFKADKDGSYHVELDAPNGERVAASPQYTIDVLTDRQPTVTFARPGRDTSASSIEEVYVEAAADDDYGVKNLELGYSVNGGPGKALAPLNSRQRPPAGRGRPNL